MCEAAEKKTKKKRPRSQKKENMQMNCTCITNSGTVMNGRVTSGNAQSPPRAATHR
jgi:hypothetical protein